MLSKIRSFAKFESNHYIIGGASLMLTLVGYNSYDTIPPNHIGYSNLFGDVGKKN